jgi:hypothetical protein
MAEERSEQAGETSERTHRKSMGYTSYPEEKSEEANIRISNSF